jgi:hypothetical protein
MRKYPFLLPLICVFFWQCTKSSTAAVGSAAGQGGSLARFAIVGNYIYAVDDQQLHVWDIRDGANPVEIKKIAAGFSIETIYPLNDKLFLGSSSAVYIFDISDPSDPKKLSTAISPSTLRHCDPVVAKDTVAFATLRSNGPCGGIRSILAVYDIRDISNPVEKGSLGFPEPYGLGYSGDILYVCDKMLGLVVLDISNAWYPVQIGSVRDGDYVDVIPYGSVLICWTSDGMILYNISDNRNPSLIAKIN